MPPKGWALVDPAIKTLPSAWMTKDLASSELLEPRSRILIPVPDSHCRSITPSASTPVTLSPLRLAAWPDCRMVTLGVPWISSFVATTSALIGALLAPVRPLAEAPKVNVSPSQEAR